MGYVSEYLWNSYLYHQNVCKACERPCAVLPPESLIKTQRPYRQDRAAGAIYYYVLLPADISGAW